MAGRKQAGASWEEASRRLAELLVAARAEHGQSQEAVARAACVALSTVRKIEKNEIKEPGIFTVLAILGALGVPPERLRDLPGRTDS